ncbi:MAG: DUF2007 domain-containing protein [Hyphomicrobium sp.]
MRDLIRTNDPVLLNFVQTLLHDAGIEAAVFDGNMSTVQGTLGAILQRIAVPEDRWVSACRILREADLKEWILE